MKHSNATENDDLQVGKELIKSSVRTYIHEHFVDTLKTLKKLWSAKQEAKGTGASRMENPIFEDKHLMKGIRAIENLNIDIALMNRYIGLTHRISRESQVSFVKKRREEYIMSILYTYSSGMRNCCHAVS